MRSDVREAAAKLWPQLDSSARRRLGDLDFEIQELFEKTVKMVSVYLDRKKAPPQDPSPLLVLKFRQQVNALARRRQRTVQTDPRELEEVADPSEWGQEADRRIFLEQLIHSLSIDNRFAWRLRAEGYDWSAIARMLQANPSTLRNNFWRELRKVCAGLEDIMAKDEE
jgi:hypothetical protein